MSGSFVLCRSCTTTALSPALLHHLVQPVAPPRLFSPPSANSSHLHHVRRKSWQTAPSGMRGALHPPHGTCQASLKRTLFGSSAAMGLSH
ncbi:uncharacterized protein BO80DRAFT_427660 [Aspergillus ibericus CBS 121593]|uniref:Uncharacterized protein n=1 Tax=Aspergillus ibericus CBS 121593 TaxID=1448316 RepID=A0A395GS21_9EURO|nr:hypothetical protein BO80DRAFT_427660 [Aspergillus ibericus CBS 121593]RAK98172.1 hypothetical protein BO80DRAFT_427660 [Aspergillus ibericus CBS 121593]